MAGGDFETISNNRKNPEKNNNPERNNESLNKQKDEKSLRGTLFTSDSYFAGNSNNAHMLKERSRQNSFHVTIAASTDDSRDTVPPRLPIKSQSGLPDVGLKLPQSSQNSKASLMDMDRPTVTREGSTRDGFSRDFNRDGFTREGSIRPGSSDLPQIPPVRTPTLGKKGKIKSGTKREEKFNNLVSFINTSRKNKGDIGDVLGKWSTFAR